MVGKYPETQVSESVLLSLKIKDAKEKAAMAKGLVQQSVKELYGSREQYAAIKHALMLVDEAINLIGGIN